MEAYHRYTPFDPASEGQQVVVDMSFMGQAPLDINRKLQILEGLQEMTLNDLVKEEERVYYKRENEEEEQRKQKEQEEHENKREKRHNQNLTQILAAVVGGSPHSRTQRENRADRAPGQHSLQTSLQRSM